MSTSLYYVHDPMCSWCWGYRPVWDNLQQYLPRSIKVKYVAGGLAPDSDTPMPLAQQQMIQDHWRTIESKLGTQFNHDFWMQNTPRRSTYNACRAAIAAHKQGCEKEMIEAIQQGYYLRALNPSDKDVLIALAKELTVELARPEASRITIKFDSVQFICDLSSAETEQELSRQVSLARVLTQQGFPSLVLEHDGKRQQISIDYNDYKSTLADIITKISH
jgi:putative protein-disulfide isomerase